MIVLETIATLTFGLWGLFSFWVIFQILKLCWPILKVDWFWFPTKSGYYKGLALGLGWFFLAMTPSAWLGESWILVPFAIQVGIAVKYTRNKPLPKLDKIVWFAMPFFMFPLWLAVRQGQQLGEIPRAA
jgi:hypothetical protein